MAFQSVDIGSAGKCIRLLIVSELRLGLRHTLSYAAMFLETQLSACSPNHSRTKFLSIPDVFKPMNALPWSLRANGSGPKWPAR